MSNYPDIKSVLNSLACFHGHFTQFLPRNAFSRFRYIFTRELPGIPVTTTCQVSWYSSDNNNQNHIEQRIKTSFSNLRDLLPFTTDHFVVSGFSGCKMNMVSLSLVKTLNYGINFSGFLFIYTHNTNLDLFYMYTTVTTCNNNTVKFLC